MENILFDITGLTHFYKGQKALDIPSLKIEKGRIYSITGPNGAGKTTLLQILASLLSPTSGLLIYDGKKMSGIDANRLRREVTLVHQNPYLFSTSVESNVAYGLNVRGMGKEELQDRVAEGLKAVGLSGMEKRSPKDLSGGEAQRVALARAFVLRPKALLLDEPSTHVDARHIKALEGVIKEFCLQYGSTVILTTHNLLQATQLSDSLITMRDGVIVEMGL